MSRRRVTMSARPEPPSNPAEWIRDGNSISRVAARQKGEVYTARLTIDVTPELRARLKLKAFGRGITVADLVRRLLEEELPSDKQLSP